MLYINHYDSPLGSILLAADNIGLTGLWFEGQTHFPHHLSAAEANLPIFTETRRWLDIYFSGAQPDFIPPLHLTGTVFQNKVWELLCTIPYGQTTTYGQIAKHLGCKSPQAIGGAVGRNPISIMVPCHRVVGAKGQLTGYAGGMEKKESLLKLEGIL